MNLPFEILSSFPDSKVKAESVAIFTENLA